MKTYTTFASEMVDRKLNDAWMPTREAPANHISRKIETACCEIRDVYWDRYDTYKDLFQEQRRQKALELAKSESARRLIERKKWKLPVDESKRLKVATINEVAKKHGLRASALESIIGYNYWERGEAAYEDLL